MYVRREIEQGKYVESPIIILNDSLDFQNKFTRNVVGKGGNFSNATQNDANYDTDKAFNMTLHRSVTSTPNVYTNSFNSSQPRFPTRRPISGCNPLDSLSTTLTADPSLVDSLNHVDYNVDTGSKASLAKSLNIGVNGSCPVNYSNLRSTLPRFARDPPSASYPVSIGPGHYEKLLPRSPAHSTSRKRRN